MRVCFVVLAAYRLFSPDAGEVFGGAEQRAWLFASGLAQQTDMEVQFVVYDYDQPSPQRLDHVDVYAHPAYMKHGSPRLIAYREHVRAALTRLATFPYVQVQRFYPALPLHLAYLAVSRSVFLLRRTLRKRQQNRASAPVDIYGIQRAGSASAIYNTLDADVYIIFGVSDVGAEVAAWCQQHKRPCVWFIAHDRDLDADRQPDADGLDWMNYPRRFGSYILNHATAIISQTEWQAQTLKARFGRDSHIIANPIRLTNTPLPEGERQFVLWVGRAHSMKQPELFVELARRLPDVKFVMVMNRGPDYETLPHHLPPNITFYEQMTYTEIDDVYAHTRLFVSTSASEGLPNTFLQAAKWGTSIISLHVDPDAMLTQGGAGVYMAGDFEALVQQVAYLWQHPDEASRLGANARRLVEKRYEANARVEEVADVLRGLLAK